LITVDHYSDWFEVDLLEDQTSKSVIQKCKKNFVAHGIPEIAICDNGVQFVSKEFRDFAKKYEFRISTCSPYHKEGNGKAESAVKIAKSLIKKSIDSKTDLELILLGWRNTPNKMGTSPTQRLYSRRTRCQVPCAPDLLLPKVVDGVKEKLIEKKLEAKHYHDRKTRKEIQFQPGEMVFVRLNDRSKKWSPGSVINQVKPRSYTVEVEGRQYRRNSIHMKPAESHQCYKPLPSASNVRPNPAFSPKVVSQNYDLTKSTSFNKPETTHPCSSDTTIANESFAQPICSSTPIRTAASQDLYLTPKQSPSPLTTPIIGRQKRSTRPPVRFVDYEMESP
jgi:Integrase core domain